MPVNAHLDPHLLLTFSGIVPPEWSDYNGHMNEAKYLEVFGQSNDRLMEVIGADAAYIAQGSSYFTMETHIRHLAEVTIGSAIEVRTHLVANTGKAIHLFHCLTAGDQAALAATGEHLLIHVDLNTRKPSSPASSVAATIASIRKTQSSVILSSAVGKGIEHR